MSLSSKSQLRFAKLSENAFSLLKGSTYAAGWDLRSAYNYVLPARGRITAQTDIQIAVPDGCYSRVGENLRLAGKMRLISFLLPASRSGLAAKFGIDTGADVIDADYRDNVGIVLFNHNDSDLTIKRDDRIAQLICEKIEMADLKLDNTVRGSNGFSSSGEFSHGVNDNCH